MNQNTLDIDRVVRQVLTELGLAANGHAAASEQAGSGTRSSGTGRSNDELQGKRELVLTARVVTLGQIKGRLRGVCRLAVPERAVITPAVRDELRQRNILVTFAATSSEKAAGENVAVGNDTKLTVVAVGTSFDAKWLSDVLGGEGVEVTSKECKCLIRATDELGPRLAESNMLGILITQHTTAGICLANRQEGVRGVLGLDPTTTASDVASVGANLLVVDADAIGHFRLKRMATQFCRGGPAVCPKVFGDRLG